ncbi:putative valine--tRNA ligase [Onchocerca flexuosa]|uniref:valine--tRNA ligase n=1 Tax=Onchocerca flexuosa TaxID=387005 RepID=A0A238BUM1_9BILA|nr:putative valine--tRNA ligase [Onchocerca flexuosa]
MAMIYPRNICFYLRKFPYCTSKNASVQDSQRNTSFDIDAVIKNYEKWIEYVAAVQAKESDPKVYRMILPPPNVTGNLHLGHALTVSIEDAMCRYRRLQGQEVIWYPGFDHAGIATQVVIERMLWNEKKLRRHQITQHDFLELCLQWKNERVADISKQLKALGATLDWRNIFSEAVTIAFCQLYSDGLIFNNFRMVNWCPTLRSTISDQEVDIVDVGKNDYFLINKSSLKNKYIEVGIMHRIRYELLNGNSSSGTNYLEVGTTRPETLFADCALAVNPNDERYVKYIGLRVQHPLLPDRTLPILADRTVKTDKGTGILKITPAHNFTDFAIARNHANQLSDEDFSRSCIDESGCLINAADFSGMDRFEARNKVIAKLIAYDKYGRTMPYHEQQLRVCSRTGDIIEPMAKKQWFMDCLTVTPKYMRPHLENWLNKKEPWCLSRQLDWGQQIPAFRPNSNSEWIVARNEIEALRIYDKTMTKVDLEQDKDVLDTWFCSSIIPIVMFAYNYEKYFKISRETRHRCLQVGQENELTAFHYLCWKLDTTLLGFGLTGYFPFPKVVLHGLVRDETGKKMSKSLGNVIDPMDIVDEGAADSLRSRFPGGISRHGPDALRFALLRHDVNAMDINIDIVQTAGEGLKFCNKLWNLCNYAEEIWRNCYEVSDQLCNDRIEDRWIKSRLESSLIIMAEKMDSDCPHLALNAMHRFLCNDLCDETTKKALWLKDYPRLKTIAEILRDIVEKSLIHLSIFMPFVSQYLFDHIKRGKDSSTFVFNPKMGSKPYLIDKKLEQDMSFALEVVKAIRSIRAQFRISMKNTLQVACYGGNCDLKNFHSIIQELCNVTFLSSVPEENNHCSLPFPVHGYSAEIHVTIMGDYGSLFKKELLRRLQKAEKRKRQSLYQIDKHEKFIRSASRDDLLERHQRKISQANAVVNVRLLLNEVWKKKPYLRLQMMSWSKRLLEWLLVGTCVLHIIMAPYTKVEESFNIQAIHDILYHRLNFNKYDHHEFPGVVPRTFMSAIAVSIPFVPVVSYFNNITKLWILYGVRLLLGLTVLFAFRKFAERIDKKFGGLSGNFLRRHITRGTTFKIDSDKYIIQSTNFNFSPLPNTFALLGAQLKTIEIVPLPNTFALLGVLWIYQKILDGHWLCAARFATYIKIVQFLLNFAEYLLKKYKCLGLSVPIDSLLWRRWVWPEGEVWWFNVILNRSHEYGVLPYFWYFYSAIPRAMIASTALVPLGALIGNTSIFLLASSRNYPGGEALTSLQYLRHFDRNKPVSVYIDNYAAQTGVNRFLHWYDAWEYNKTENLEPSQLARFDFLLIGSYVEPDIVNFTATNFISTHRISYDVEVFRGVELRRMRWFPYYWPVIKFNPQLVVLEKLHYSDSFMDKRNISRIFFSYRPFFSVQKEYFPGSKWAYNDVASDVHYYFGILLSENNRTVLFDKKAKT